jgi:HemY protein
MFDKAALCLNDSGEILMRRILLLLFFIAALWVGVKIAQDSGYIFIAYQHSSIEMPLWLGFGLVFLIFLTLYILFRLLHHISFAPQYWQFWSKKWRKQRAIKKTSQGFLDILNGRFRVGEKRLLRAAGDSPFGLINYLSAAKAAFFQKAYTRSETYFEKALEQTPEASVAVGITKASLEIENKNWDKALNILKPLALEAPKNPTIWALLKVIYQQLQRWSDLVAILPRLRKSPLENTDSLKEVEYQGYFGLLENAKENIHEVWQMMPRNLRQDPRLVGLYAIQLNSMQQYTESEIFLRKYLKNSWNEALVETYSMTVTPRPGDQLRFLEKFLKQHSDNAKLCLCLGRLAMNAKLWGKGKHYLEMSIKQHPCAEAYRMLGKILEVLGDKEGAFTMYRKVVDLS